LPTDAALAFRERAKSDRARLLRLAGQVRDPIAWPRLARPLAAIEDLAHGLAGTGGVFGFPALSVAAARVERMAERWRLTSPATLSARRKASLKVAIERLLSELDLDDRTDPSWGGE
jgi:HPt (histidine-containing phosphotransfer) domain-containing protein